MTQCLWQIAWVGRCKEETPPGGSMCVKHMNEKCVSCGEPATHDCDETGQFVCGAPLCDNCEHTTRSDGTNGGIGFYETVPLPEGMTTHCRKSEQVFDPWYMREKNG